jgi:hypothetical protein
MSKKSQSTADAPLKTVPDQSSTVDVQLKIVPAPASTADAVRKIVSRRASTVDARLETAGNGHPRWMLRSKRFFDGLPHQSPTDGHQLAAGATKGILPRQVFLRADLFARLLSPGADKPTPRGNLLTVLRDASRFPDDCVASSASPRRSIPSALPSPVAIAGGGIEQTLRAQLGTSAGAQAGSRLGTRLKPANSV